MRINCLSLLLLILLLADQLSAQYYDRRPEYLRANSKWTFGKNLGLDFSSGAPVPFQSASASHEGNASVADRATGALLFYSDGATCWNREHTVMLNGSGLLGNRGSAAQGVCIVPVIDTPEKYYLFSLEQNEHNTGRLYYSVVDMRLDNGRGGIEAGRKNIQLDAGLSESMVAVPGDQCDIWLMVHAREIPFFKAYHITASGINATPILSNAGTITGGLEYRQGVIAISPDRRKIAVSSFSAGGGVIVAEFDPATGQVSNALDILRGHCFGLAFSPDNQKLYVRQQPSGASWIEVYQYDLSVWTLGSIVTSRVLVHNGLRAAGDIKAYNGALYFPDFVTNHLDRINSPDLPGVACDYEDTAIRLAGWAGNTLTNSVALPLPSAQQTVARKKDTTICAGSQRMELPLPAMEPGFILRGWDNGTTDSLRVITGPGTYWHTTWYPGCRMVVDTIVVHPLDLSFEIEGDTVVCNGRPAVLHIPVEGVERVWSDGSTDSVIEVTRAGRYWARITRDGCVARDTVRVTSVNIPLNLGSDTMVCASETIHLRLQAYVPAGATATWHDGSTADSLVVSGPGAYWVVVEKEGCAASDTLQVVVPDLSQNLGEDRSFCMNDPIRVNLQANVPEGGEALWSDGSSSPLLYVADTGRYWVEVRHGACFGSDTVHLAREQCECLPLVPGAFTPNGDGRNDRLRVAIPSGCPVRQFSLQIFNRWGQLVYSGTDPLEGWDGTSNGTAAEAGTYMYYLRFEGGTKGVAHTRKGDITLIR
jgi:gliding motility-associated-like protein